MNGKQRIVAAMRHVDRIETADDNVQHFRRGSEAAVYIFRCIPHDPQWWVRSRCK